MFKYIDDNIYLVSMSTSSVSDCLGCDHYCAAKQFLTWFQPSIIDPGKLEIHHEIHPSIQSPLSVKVEILYNEENGFPTDADVRKKSLHSCC